MYRLNGAVTVDINDDRPILGRPALTTTTAPVRACGLQFPEREEFRRLCLIVRTLVESVFAKEISKFPTFEFPE